jgi:RNA polymerase sigma factor (sigma-70 family)
MHTFVPTFSEERDHYKFLFEAIQKGDHDLLLAAFAASDDFENNTFKLFSDRLPFYTPNHFHDSKDVELSNNDIVTDERKAMKTRLLHDPIDGLQFLMENYGLLFERIAQAILHNNDLVQDALSVSWYKIYNVLKKAEDEKETIKAETLLAYLCTIVRNAAYSLYVREKKQRLKLLKKGKEIEIVERWYFAKPEEELEREELQHLIQEILTQLPTRYERILRLRYLTDHKCTEDERFCQLAEELNIKSGTLRSQVKRGKALMRKRLAERGIRAV